MRGKKQWQAYFSLSGLDAQANEKQVQALTLCFFREMITIVENLGLTDEQRKSAKEIITAIEAYVNGKINESVEQHTFRSRVQQEGETFDWSPCVSSQKLATFVMTSAHKRTFATRSSQDWLTGKPWKTSSRRRTSPLTPLSLNAVHMRLPNTREWN